MTIEITSEETPRIRAFIDMARNGLLAFASFAQRNARLLRYGFGGVVLVVSLGFLSSVIYFYVHYSKIVDERLAAGYLTSNAGIYAAPRVLRAGQSISPERLTEILRRAGYVEGEASRVWSGRFVKTDGAIDIHPRKAGMNVEAVPYDVVRIEYDRAGRIKQISGDSSRLQSYALEPEALTNNAGVKTDEHEALGYKDLPPVLVHAILAIEDRRFFDHGGLDPIGIARAALSWSDHEQDLKQGGSTITQQLVKNTYLSHERTLRRKFHEAIIASVIERRMTKEDIFALYCNEIYLGRRGSVGVRGVQQASRVFFGKELKDLSLTEAATIAGMIQSPGRYAPDRHQELARVRRNTVLAAMLRDNWITAEEASTASREPVSVAQVHDASGLAPHFIDYVNRLTSESRPLDEDDDETQGSRVYTTIDIELQQLAERAVTRQLEALRRAFKGKKQPQAALVALDPRNGHVLAMVGGGPYAESQLNRATDARRQPGSVFKPLVYAAAIEAGISPLSMTLDAPREFAYDYRAKYRPANYGGGYTMHDVTLRTALVRSLNVVTVETAMRTGLSRVAALASRLGLPEPKPYPALALGSNEATPLEVAGAYTAFANGGRVVRPKVIDRVDHGAPAPRLMDEPRASEQVLKPSTAYMLTDMLTDVINRGTARAARGAVKRTAIAGKTGTSRDGWFAGYTPNLVCVVWVGFDDGSELDLTGAESALPIWTAFVKGAVELRPELGGERFARPGSITFVEIDPATGALASESCPYRERVAITPSFAPTTECFAHGTLPDALMTLDAEEIYEAHPGVSADLSVPVVVENPAAATRVTPATTALGNRAVRRASAEMKRNGRPTLTNDMSAGFQ
jgi:penicillin-binding protein 1B